MKKSIRLWIIGLMVVSICACSQSSDVNVTEHSETVGIITLESDMGASEMSDASMNTESALESVSYINLLGYDIAYPGEGLLGSAGIGNAFLTENYSVILGAPAAAGDFIEVESLEDAIERCKKYITDTLEVRDRDILTADSTIQLVDKSDLVSNNGIDMLKVVGVFQNTSKGTEVDYVAYYFCRDKYPAYIVAIPREDDSNGLEAFMDDMARHIEKAN